LLVAVLIDKRANAATSTNISFLSKQIIILFEIKKMPILVVKCIFEKILMKFVLKTQHTYMYHISVT